MIALASTLGALIIAIIVVLGLRPTDSTPNGPSGSTAESKVRTGAECLVGHWRTTGHTEQVEVPTLGRMTFTGGQGARLSLEVDGTGITNYGEGTTYRSAHQGEEVVLEIRGIVNFRYTPVAGGRMGFADTRSGAEFRIRVGSVRPPGNWQAFVASTDESSYTCTGNSLTRESLVFSTIYSRLI